MKLKEYPRREYKVNPLVEVIWQLKFPTILKISEEPVDFQDKIRKEYPEYIPPNIPNDIPSFLQTQFPTYHKFTDESKVWQIHLGKNDISLLNFDNYTSFEGFKMRFEQMVKIFEEVYEPASYSRIGVRYKNLINDDIFDFKDKKWNELIPKNISPELHEEDKGENKVKEFNKRIVLNEGDETVNLLYVFSYVSGMVKGREIKNKLSYIIDIDCYKEDKINGKDELFTTIDKFKFNIRNLFGYSITDELNDVLEQTE